MSEGEFKLAIVNLVFQCSAHCPGFLRVLLHHPTSGSGTLEVSSLLKVADEQQIPNVNRATLYAGLIAMENVKMGKVKIGRRGMSTRIELNPHVTVDRIIHALRIQTSNVSQGAQSSSTIPSSPIKQEPHQKSTSTTQELVVHQFPLRPNVTLQLPLPVDLTLREVERLNAFLNSIVLS